jgi:hypothetical protein
MGLFKTLLQLLWLSLALKKVVWYLFKLVWQREIIVSGSYQLRSCSVSKAFICICKGKQLPWVHVTLSADSGLWTTVCGGHSDLPSVGFHQPDTDFQSKDSLLSCCSQWITMHHTMMSQVGVVLVKVVPFVFKANSKLEHAWLTIKKTCTISGIYPSPCHNWQWCRLKYESHQGTYLCLLSEQVQRLHLQALVWGWLCCLRLYDGFWRESLGWQSQCYIGLYLSHTGIWTCTVWRVGALQANSKSGDEANQNLSLSYWWSFDIGTGLEPLSLSSLGTALDLVLVSKTVGGVLPLSSVSLVGERVVETSLSVD